MVYREGLKMRALTHEALERARLVLTGRIAGSDITEEDQYWSDRLTEACAGGVSLAGFIRRVALEREPS